MPGTELQEIFSTEVIAERISIIAEEINQRYAGERVVFICVLKGAFMFFSDLIRRITISPEIDFVRLASYGKSDTTSGTISFSKDVEIFLQDKHVILVEDVVDSGLTMNFLSRQMDSRGVKSLRIAALVDKKERRQVDVRVDFVGFHVTSGFIVGYGMDYAEKYRELPAIYCLEADFQ